MVRMMLWALLSSCQRLFNRPGSGLCSPPRPPPVKKQVTVGAGTCIEEGGDPVPHLEALDPILGELTELETRVKKAPTDEVDDARCVFIVHYYYQESGRCVGPPVGRVCCYTGEIWSRCVVRKLSCSTCKAQGSLREFRGRVLRWRAVLARAELHRCWSASSRPPFVRVRTRLLVRLLLSCSFASMSMSMAVTLRLQGYSDGVEAPAGGPRAAGHGEGDGPRQARHGHTQARSPGAFFLFFYFSSPLCFPDMSTHPHRRG